MDHFFTKPPSEVEDHGEPGSTDKIWVEVRDKDGLVLVGLSLPTAAGSHSELLLGGNVVVPHGVNE